jgi:NitT/TauT family transport system permease protein
VTPRALPATRSRPGRPSRRAPASLRKAGRGGAEVLRWVVSLGLLLAVWQWLLVPHSSPVFVAAPSAVWHELGSMSADGSLWSGVGTTLAEALVGFAIGLGIGMVFALAIGLMVPLVGKVLEPVVTAVYTSPKFVLAPILFIWFGAGFAPRVVLVAADVFPVIAIYALGGIRTVNTDVVLALRLYGGNWRHVTGKVLVPHISGDLVTAVTVALPRAVTIAIGVEILFGTTTGIGGLLNTDTDQFSASGVWATLVVGTVISALFITLTQFAGAATRRHFFGDESGGRQR